MIPDQNRPRAPKIGNQRVGLRALTVEADVSASKKSKRGPRQALGQMRVWAHAIERKIILKEKIIVE